MDDNHYAYKRGPGQASPGYYDKPKRKKTTRKAANPEHRFQMGVVEALTWALPEGYLYTANGAGVRLSMHLAVKMKAAGVKRGWPDIQILCPDGCTRYLELKDPERHSGESALSPEQKAFRDACKATGRDIWGRAQSLDEVEAHLKRWGVPLRMPLAYANRYQAPLYKRQAR